MRKKQNKNTYIAEDVVFLLLLVLVDVVLLEVVDGVLVVHAHEGLLGQLLENDKREG